MERIIVFVKDQASFKDFERYVGNFSGEIMNLNVEVSTLPKSASNFQNDEELGKSFVVKIPSSRSELSMVDLFFHLLSWENTLGLETGNSKLDESIGKLTKRFTNRRVTNDWYPFGKDDFDEEVEAKNINELRKVISKKSFNNDYKVERLCGRGTFAATYICRIKGLEPPPYFAVKILTTFDEKEVKEKMIKKDCLDIEYHRNVVPILSDVSKVESIDLKKLDDYESSEWKDYGLDKISTSLIVMRDHKNDLLSYLEKRKKNVVPTGILNSVDQWKRVTSRNIETCRMMKGLLFGVRHLHEHGIVHRDLHDENVFVEAEKGRIWIGDFGLHINVKNNPNGFKVQRDDSNFISQKSYGKNIGGEGLYLPPEIIDTEEDILDYEKCDIFSVGVLSYRIVSVLFGDGSFFPFGKIEGEDLPVEKKKRKYFGLPKECFGVDEGISKLIKSLLELDPRKRIGYNDACERITLLTELLDYKYKVIEDDPENVSFLSIGGKTMKGLEKQQPPEYRLMMSFFNLGEDMLKKRRCKEAIEVFQKSLGLLQEKFQKRKRDIGITYFNLGFARRKVGQFEKALEDLSQSLKIWVEVEDTEEEENENLAKCILEMGIANLGLKQIEKAKRCLEKSLEMITTLYDGKQRYSNDILRNFNFLAVVYENEDNFEKSIEFHTKCFEMEMKQYRIKAVSRRLILLTRCMCGYEQYEQAYRFSEELLEKMLGETKKDRSIPGLIVKCHKAMGEICIKKFKKDYNTNFEHPNVSETWKNRLVKGKESLLKVLGSFQESHPGFRAISLDLAVVHEIFKENREALEIYEKFGDEEGRERINYKIYFEVFSATAAAAANVVIKGVSNYFSERKKRSEKEKRVKKRVERLRRRPKLPSQRYFYGNMTECPSDGNGIESDSLQMNIVESHGRQNYTCLSLFKLIGIDGKRKGKKKINFALKKLGVWSSSSYWDDGKEGYHPKQLGLVRVPRSNCKYFHFNHVAGGGTKWLKWKSMVGAVKIIGLSFSPRLDGRFMDDFPKIVEISLMKDGKCCYFERHEFENPKNDQNDARESGTPWITFKAKSVLYEII